jgi:hypothetical protein
MLLLATLRWGSRVARHKLYAEDVYRLHSPINDPLTRQSEPRGVGQIDAD